MNMNLRLISIAAVMSAGVVMAHATDVTDLVGGQGWLGNYDNAGAGANAIVANPTNDGDGSLSLTTTGSPDRSRVGLFAAPGGQLGQLGQIVNGGLVQFDFYRDATSTATSNIQLAFKLYVRNASGQTGSLIWEDAYNGSAAAIGSWNDNRLISSENWWIRSGGINYQQAANALTLGTWIGGGTVTDGSNTSIALGSDTAVTGIEIGAGSGWAGTFSGNADDVRVTFGTQPAGVWNFKTEAVPEPATMAALGMGALALLRRRRKA